MNARVAIGECVLPGDAACLPAVAAGNRSLPFAHLVSRMSIITSQSVYVPLCARGAVSLAPFGVFIHRRRLGNCKRTRSLLICSCLILMVASNANNGIHSVFLLPPSPVHRHTLAECARLIESRAPTHGSTDSGARTAVALANQFYLVASNQFEKNMKIAKYGFEACRSSDEDWDTAVHRIANEPLSTERDGRHRTRALSISCDNSVRLGLGRRQHRKKLKIGA